MSKFAGSILIKILPALILYLSLIVAAIITSNSYLTILAFALPAVLLLSFLAIYNPHYFAVLLTLMIPLSINLKDIGMGFGISIPGEAMTFLISLLIIINLIRGRYINKAVLMHPVSIAIGIYLLWMAVSTAFSTMPLVSIKFLFIRFAFILSFYLFFLQVFGNKHRIREWLWLYTLGLIPVILFILYRHAQYGFIQQVNRYVAQPFFNDHTIFGAVMAMLLPFFILLPFLKKEERKLPRYLFILVSIVLLTGIFFSYSRAVWLGVALTLPFGLLLLLQIRFTHFLLGLGLLFALAVYFKAPLEQRMKSIESERGGDILEHAESIANINTSASNRERINRWESALAMFREKPVLGFGPGTFPFQYAPFQREENLTRISTYYGDQGGAHSEYLKPLSETGWPGLLGFVAVILLSIRSAFRIIYRAPDRQTKIIAVALLLGLSTYYVHGFVNFFLDTEKTSALFWGMTGLLVALDIQISKNKKAIELLM